MTSITASSTSIPVSQPRKSRVQLHLWVDFLLLAFMLANLVLAMNSAQWSNGLDRLFPVVVIAIIAGALVALSGFNRLFSFTFTVIVGAAAIIWSMSALAPEELIEQERAYHIIMRTIGWTYNAINGQPVADNMIFILLLSVLVSLLAFGAMWAYLREGRKWQAIIPTGLAMLVILYYAPPRLNAYFVIYLLSAILLLVRATLAEKQTEWYYARVHFPFDISFDFMRDGLLFAVFVIFVSWVLPGATTGGPSATLLEPFREPWQQFQQEWTRLFSTINYGRTTGTPTFGTSLSLGGPRNVTDEIVMDVSTPEDRYYRAVIMDTYLPGGWVMQNTSGVRVQENDQFELQTWNNRREITQTVTVYQPGNVLVAAPQPVQALLPADARIIPAMTLEAQASSSQATGETVQAEYAMLVSRSVLNAGDTYQVVSSIADTTETSLRADSTDYPEYIKERYLQLSESVPQRVFDLAEDVAQGQNNPYDIAKAIEAYLRGYVYNDQIPGPAPGQDGVDYFLFEEKQGYCNYYASSMAVMLRHLGIPARLAVGYATGEFMPDTGVYRLRNNDSHTWVEAYFPNHGWIEFEPTASEPVLFRPTGEVEEADDESTAGNSDPFAFDENRNIPVPEEELPEIDLNQEAAPTSWLENNAGPLMLVGSILGILVLAVWSVRRIQNPGRLKRPVFRTVPAGFSTRLWDKLMVWARRLGLGQSPSLTPLEQASVFASSVPEAATNIDAIATLYTRDLYSPYDLTTDEASEAQLSWLVMRPLLWKHWVRQHLHLPKGLRRSLFVRDRKT